MIDSAAGLFRILTDHRTIAVVGMSEKWHRPSHFAAKYMLQHGYEVIPINPTCREILGCKCYPDLASVPQPIHIVDCFRRAEQMPALAQQAATIGARVFWMQLGVANPQAAQIAAAANMDVVGDRCIKIEHGRLFGGLNFAGVNTGIISPRRRQIPR